MKFSEESVSSIINGISADDYLRGTIPFEDKMTDLTAILRDQFAQSADLEQAIKKNLEVLGYGE